MKKLSPKLILKIIFCIAISNFQHTIIAQSNSENIVKSVPILNLDSFSAGIFETFQDFKNNKITHQDYIVNVKSNRNYSGFNEPFSKSQKIRVIDSLGNKINYKTEKFWGYSNGENVFIKQNDLFFKIHTLGRYCLFDYFSSVSIPIIDTGMGGISTLNLSNNGTYYIDIANGKIDYLNIANMKILLLNYPELSAKFKKERGKSNMLLWYINKINEIERLK